MCVCRIVGLSHPVICTLWGKSLACKAGEIQQRFQCQVHSISLFRQLELGNSFCHFLIFFCLEKEKGVSHPFILSRLSIIPSYEVCLFTIEGRS